MRQNTEKYQTWKKAFMYSVPILCSYFFVGMAYGMTMENAGFHWYYSLLISVTVYTGAFQFVLITLLSSGDSILTIALTAVLMNSRQSFYALTFLDEFKQMGKKMLYMIHTMTDETYAVNCSMKKEESNRHEIMFGVALLSKSYWVIAAVLGGIAGQLIPFDLTGIDFCMTALFVVIFVDQWEQAESHVPAVVGLLTSCICLFVVGTTYFLLPSLILSSGILMVWNHKREVA